MVRDRKTARDVLVDIISTLPKGVHLSAQELRDKALERGQSVNLSTIYRALERLNDEGEVRSIVSARGQLWESVDDDDEHDHLICTRCGITIEFSDSLVSGFGKTLAERKGYVYQESRFDIFGFCSSCKSKSGRGSFPDLHEAIDEAIDILDGAHEALHSSMEAVENGKAAQARAKLAVAKDLLAKCIGRCEAASELMDS